MLSLATTNCAYESGTLAVALHVLRLANNQPYTDHFIQQVRIRLTT